MRLFVGAMPCVWRRYSQWGEGEEGRGRGERDQKRVSAHDRFAGSAGRVFAGVERRYFERSIEPMCTSV